MVTTVQPIAFRVPQTSKRLPKEFEFVYGLGDLPNVIDEFLKTFGILEYRGADNNPTIINWAKEIGVYEDYKADSTPWCGLEVGVCVKRAGYKPPSGLLGARNWIRFGNEVLRGDEKFGDILIFNRPGGNHVGFYFGESETHFAVGAGNQSDAVNIKWIPKANHIATRRCPYKFGPPASVRKFKFDKEGEILTSAA